MLLDMGSDLDEIMSNDKELSLIVEQAYEVNLNYLHYI